MAFLGRTVFFRFTSEMGVPILSRTVSAFFTLSRGFVFCLLKLVVSSFSVTELFVRPILCRYKDLQYPTRCLKFVTCRIVDLFCDKGATFLHFYSFWYSVNFYIFVDKCRYGFSVRVFVCFRIFPLPANYCFVHRTQYVRA